MSGWDWAGAWDWIREQGLALFLAMFSYEEYKIKKLEIVQEQTKLDLEKEQNLNANLEKYADMSSLDVINSALAEGGAGRLEPASSPSVSNEPGAAGPPSEQDQSKRSVPEEPGEHSGST